MPQQFLVKNSLSGGHFPRIVVCNSHCIIVYVHFTCWELFFRYFKHLPAKLYFAANTYLGRKYPFSLCWGKRTFHCQKHISDKTSTTKDIPHSCIFFLFISYVYYTCCHLHFYSLLFIFILLSNFLREWISRTETVGYVFAIFTCVQKEPPDSQIFILEQMALFSPCLHRISASFFCECNLQCQH